MPYRYFFWFVALVALSFSCSESAKPQILLVGVYHSFPDSQQCNWKSTYDKILRYKPDQISIEYDRPGDTVSLKNYLGDDYLRIWDSVMVSWVGKRVNPSDSVLHYQKSVHAGARAMDRLNLWKYYHLNADIGNRDFQSFLIQSDWSQYASEIDTTNAWMKDFCTRYQSTIARRRNGEFFNLVFPLAKTIGIHYLYPTDYKGTYKEQSRAFEALAQSLENTKEWTDYMAAFKEFSNELDVKAAECVGLDFTNTEQWLAKSDYMQAQYLNSLKNSSFDAYTTVWYKRNKEIANRIHSAIQVSGSKRMVVFYGQMHVFPVRKYLYEMGYQVELLEDLKIN